MCSFATVPLICAQAETGQITPKPSPTRRRRRTERAHQNCQRGKRRPNAIARPKEPVYSVTNLEPVDYGATATAAGSSEIKQRFTLTVGQKLDRNLKLQVGSTATTVEVTETANALQVNTETQTVSQVVGTRSMCELPQRQDWRAVHRARGLLRYAWTDVRRSGPRRCPRSSYCRRPDSAGDQSGAHYERGKSAAAQDDFVRARGRREVT
jgi:hypothetical protein